MKGERGRTFALAIAMALTACGDGGSGAIDARDQTDAPLPDARPDGMPDTRITDPPMGPFLEATIAITELRITNDLSATPGLEDGLAGASIRVEYIDLTTATVPPIFGPALLSLGECHVYVYDAGESGPPRRADEGNVTIEGTVHGAPITCAFDGLAYRCVLASGDLVAGTDVAADAGSGTATVTLAGVDLGAIEPVGAWLGVTGFASAGNNGLFPIVDTGASSAELVIANPDAADETLAAAGGTWTLRAGVGPIPGGGAGFDFLDDGTAALAISKADGAMVPAFSAAIHASGQGLALAPTSPPPHAFPATSDTDWTLSCEDPNGDAAPGGTCGPRGGIVVGFALSGRTTDGDLDTGCAGGACSPVEMPPPAAQWAEFACRGELGAQDITLPIGAIAAILDTGPTRVETRLVRITSNLAADPTGVTSIVAGHGLVGYTDL